MDQTVDTPPEPKTLSAPAVLLRWLIITALGALFCDLLIGRMRHLNGMPFHHYDWRWIAAWRVYPPMILAAMPAVAAQFVRRRSVMIGLLMLSTFALELTAAGVASEPFDLGRIAQIVAEPNATSYFTDAIMLSQQPSLRESLRAYPGMMGYLHTHSRQKPPGQVLFYLFWLKVNGDGPYGSAAMMAGLAIALLVTGSVLSCWWLARRVTRDESAARAAASFFALSPALTLIFPSFDQVYPIATCLIVGLWLLALEAKTLRRSLVAAAGCGAATAVASFFAYSPLVLGALCAALAGWCVWRWPSMWPRVVGSVGVVLGVIVGAYGLLWLTTGFDAIETFRSAMFWEEMMQRGMIIPRTYPRTLPWDLRDFLFGQGWIGLPLILLGLGQLRRSRRRVLILLCVGEIGLVWITALLRAETARVWLFLQPLMMLLIGVELGRWPRWGRALLLVTLAIVTACVAQNIRFISDGQPLPQPQVFNVGGADALTQNSQSLYLPGKRSGNSLLTW